MKCRLMADLTTTDTYVVAFVAALKKRGFDTYSQEGHHLVDALEGTALTPLKHFDLRIYLNTVFGKV